MKKKARKHQRTVVKNRKKKVVLTPQQAFEHQIWEKYKRCCNCSGEDGLRIVLLVPIENGGKWTVTNGALLCRQCVFARDESRQDTQQGERMFTVFPGAGLIRLVKMLLGEKSLSSLIRSLMQEWADHGDTAILCPAIEELDTVKVNVRMTNELFDAFGVRCREAKRAQVDVLAQLLTWYCQSRKDG